MSRPAWIPAQARPIARVGAVAAVAAAMAVLVSGCVSGPAPSPSPPAPSSSAEASAEPSTPAAPALVPGGTAQENLAYFDLVNSTFLAANPTPGGRPIIDNLVAVGFDKGAMQVTQDATPFGHNVDSVQFSVHMGDSCLIGQTSAAGYVGIAGPPITSTSCLAGSTRTIDW